MKKAHNNGIETLNDAIYLHFFCNGFTLRQNVPQVHGPQHVPQRGGGQQPGGAAVVVHVGHGVGRVGHLVVHDGVHKHRHTVLRQDLSI